MSTWSLNRSRGAGVSQAGRCPQPGGETDREKGGPDKMHEDRGVASVHGAAGAEVQIVPPGGHRTMVSVAAGPNHIV